MQIGGQGFVKFAAIISGLNPYDKLIRLEPPSSAPGTACYDAVVHAEAVDGVARVDVQGEGAGGQGPGADAAGEAAGVERCAVGGGLQVGNAPPLWACTYDVCTWR